MELPKLHRDPQQQQHRRSVDKMGSGELSLAGSTKGLEDEWVVSSTPAPMPEATPVQQLKLYQKVLYGMGASYAFNALVVTNGADTMSDRMDIIGGFTHVGGPGWQAPSSTTTRTRTAWTRRSSASSTSSRGWSRSSRPWASAS